MFLNLSFLWILSHFHACSKLIDFVQICEISWECVQKAYSDSICPVRVQQKTNTELLSLLVPGTALQPALFLTLLQLWLFWRGGKLICHFFLSSENTGVYLSFAQRAERSWNRSCSALPNKEMQGRRVNPGWRGSVAVSWGEGDWCCVNCGVAGVRRQKSNRTHENGTFNSNEIYLVEYLGVCFSTLFFFFLIFNECYV